MKKTILVFLIAISLLSIGCQNEVTITSFNASNKLGVDRPNEIVTIKFSEIPNFEMKKNLVVKLGDEILITQLVDSDLDGELDELIFMDSFNKKEYKKYTLVSMKEPAKFDQKAYVTFIEGREDIAWENDLIAFRMYGPPLKDEVNNGIDVWSKSVDHLIIDKWYKEESEGKSYHVDHGEGADFYSVGKSLGAGGSAVLLDDKLYQSGVYTSYKILDNGPLMVRFQLVFENAEIGEDVFTETKTVTLKAGSALNFIKSEYTELPADVQNAAGLVIRDESEEIVNEDKEYIGLWRKSGKDEKDGFTGIAVVGLGENNSVIKKNESDSNHILLVEEKENEMFAYYTGAIWSKQSLEIKSKTDWEAYLNQFIEKQHSPIVIEFNKE